MSRAISHTKLDETLTLSECTDGFWLYDTTRGMNLAMSAKTEQEAFYRALKYYQKRLADVEDCHSKLCNKVDSFLEQFKE